MKITTEDLKKDLIYEITMAKTGLYPEPQEIAIAVNNWFKKYVMQLSATHTIGEHQLVVLKQNQDLENYFKKCVVPKLLNGIAEEIHNAELTTVEERTDYIGKEWKINVMALRTYES